jgi:hypothetical protein
MRKSRSSEEQIIAILKAGGARHPSMTPRGRASTAGSRKPRHIGGPPPDLQLDLVRRALRLRHRVAGAGADRVGGRSLTSCAARARIELPCPV